jgi:osmotically-inducible protein OsmY
MIHVGSRRTRSVGVIVLGLLAALTAHTALTGATPHLVRPVDVPSDAWLTTTAKIAILTSIGTRGTVQVDTRNATMTLYGKVGSAAEIVDVERLARGVEGVGEVRNLLMVAPVPEGGAVATSDSELQSRVAVALIAASLKRESPLDRSDVSVRSVDNGTVFLAGTASLAAHLRAIETAKNVRGVRAVRSDIRSPDAAAVYQPRFLGK